MSEYSLRLGCPLCHHVASAPADGTGLRYECSVCRAKFTLDAAATRRAADLLLRRAVVTAGDAVHCGECGSALFRQAAGKATRDG